MDIVPQLDTTTYPSQLFWLLLSFVLLYLIISKKILPKIENTIKKRYILLSNSLQKSDTMSRFSQQEYDKQKALINNARLKASRIIDEAKKEVEHMKYNIKHILDEEIAELYKQSNERITIIQNEAKEELINLATSLSLVYYNKVLSHSYNDTEKLKDIIIKLAKENL